MTVLVTGAAGFIGYHVAEALLGQGRAVVGVDNLNAYYDVRLKEARLARLSRHKNFTIVRADIADRAAMADTVARHADIEGVVHLAAQAGVRHSLVDPYAYTHSNVDAYVGGRPRLRTAPTRRCRSTPPRRRRWRASATPTPISTACR